MGYATDNGGAVPPQAVLGARCGGLIAPGTRERVRCLPQSIWRPRLRLPAIALMLHSPPTHPTHPSLFWHVRGMQAGARGAPAHPCVSAQLAVPDGGGRNWRRRLLGGCLPCRREHLGVESSQLSPAASCQWLLVMRTWLAPACSARGYLCLGMRRSTCDAAHATRSSSQPPSTTPTYRSLSRASKRRVRLRRTATAACWTAARASTAPAAGPPCGAALDPALRAPFRPTRWRSWCLSASRPPSPSDSLRNCPSK